MALNTSNGSELLSYIINVDPILKEEIDLPVQGESIKPIGEIIVDNTRYKNAFINALNVIAVTLITQNDWDNPWEEFTEQGKINFGQSVREMIVDLVKGQDYNTYKDDETHFLENYIPDVYNYIYDINFQKFYKVTVNDSEISMAFTSETGLYDLISNIYSRLYESYKYDKYLVDKYQLIRRILSGSISSVSVPESAETPRQVVGFMKSISNKLTFRTPNYNPAGLRIGTSFEKQRTIVNTDFDGVISTDVLATSFFRNDAEMKTKLAMIDSFDDLDEERLSDLLGDSYIALTETDKANLSNVMAVIISDDFFKDYYYSMSARDNSAGATKMTEFYNPETLNNTMWLHVWRIFATSPFANAVVITASSNDVDSVSIDPATVTVSAGQSVKLTADVTVSGIANKAVQWTVDSDSVALGVTINANGVLSVPSDVESIIGDETEITVTATSIYKPAVTDTATVTVAGNKS